MKKVSGLLFCSLWLLAGLAVVPAAPAGPLVEFGEDGYLKLDLKTQVYIENTDIGSGPNGTSDRTDIHFQRNRLTITGMLDEGIADGVLSRARIAAGLEFHPPDFKTEKRFFILTFRCRMITSLQVHYTDIEPDDNQQSTAEPLRVQ